MPKVSSKTDRSQPERAQPAAAEPDPQSAAQTADETPSLTVSVVLVVFNQAEALRRALQALERAQDRARFEILVIDCGSQDASRTMDADFPSINLLRLPHHLGAARAMNIAARTAKADLVLYLSPDVEIGPKTVTSLADRLEHDPETVVACALLVDPRGTPVTRIHPLPDGAMMKAAAHGAGLPSVDVDLNQTAIDIGYPAEGAMLVRKPFIRGMNYFDERYGHYWVEAELAMQVKRAGKRMRLYPGIRAVIHAAPDPLAGDPIAETDRLVGASEWLAKYAGGGFGLRLGAAFSALGKFSFGQALALLSGSKLNGQG